MTVPPYQETQHYRQAVQNPSIARIKPKWLFGAGALILVLGGYWYYNSVDSSSSRAPRVAAAPVRVATATRRDMAVVERTIGTVVANETVQVTSRVQGVIDKAAFKEGQFVKKDELLFQIDPRSFQAALAQARAQLEKDRSQIDSAVNNEKRYKTLFGQSAISSQQLDAAVAAAGSAIATVDADKAAVQIAELNLSYTQIRSPVNGQAGPMLVQPGNMVAANGTTTLVTINQIQPIKVSFALPQSDLPRIQARRKMQGLSATLNMSDQGGQDISAPVDFVSNNVNNISGTIELRATFNNSDAALVPGQLVNVVVELNNIPHATVVPREAVNTGPTGQYVYVVTPEKRAVQQPVQLLFDNDTDAAIEGDVKPGDQVIVDGQLRVVPGAKVFVEGARASGRSAGGARKRRGGPRRSTGG